jgi:hypothetical protein
MATVLLAGSIHMFEAKAQGEAAVLLKSGKEDANKILNAYMTPLFKGFASGANIGWYNTARPHGTGGFDITMSLGLFTVPTDNQTFTVSSLNLGNSGPYKLEPADANTDPNKPIGTLFGTPPDSKQNYNIRYTMRFDTIIAGNPINKDTTVTIGSIQMPEGADVPMFLSIPPAAQFAIGIYKNTEVMLRILPEITTQGFTTSMFGFGVKHDIKQWIPGIKDMPLWDWSGVFGYTSYNNSYALADKDRLKVAGNAEYEQAYNSAEFIGKSYDNQKFTFNGSGWMFGTVISAKLGPLTPYLGINYNTSVSTFEMAGNYPMLIAETDQANPNFGKPKIMELSNPITIEGKVSGLRINPGFRLKMLLLTVHYDFSYNTYGFNLHTVGLGINLQSIVPFKL